jgi:hypothetical protein
VNMRVERNVVKVFVGACLCSIIGYLLGRVMGRWVTTDLTQHDNGTAVGVVTSLSAVAGWAAGGIIGAIAGAVAAIGVAQQSEPLRIPPSSQQSPRE